MTRMRESVYNIRVPLRRSRALLFNSLSRSLCMLEADELDLLDRIDEQVDEPYLTLIHQLMSQGFVVRDGTDELGIAQKQYEALRHDPGSVTVTVCPTLACNFGCDYCFQGAEKPVQKMAATVQDQTVELYRRILDRLPHIHTMRAMWYGGEPLLHPSAIERLSRRFIDINRERGIDFSAAMISNGSRMDRAMAPLMTWVNTTDPDARFAGDLRLADWIPLFGRRHAFVNFTLAHPFRGGYFAVVRQRIEAVYDAIYADDLRRVLAFLDDTGVDYLVVDHAAFARVEAGFGRLFEPMRSTVNDTMFLPRRGRFVLETPPPAAVVFEHGQIQVIGREALRAVLAGP